jgi:hypothetical protein
MLWGKKIQEKTSTHLKSCAMCLDYSVLCYQIPADHMAVAATSIPNTLLLLLCRIRAHTCIANILVQLPLNRSEQPSRENHLPLRGGARNLRLPSKCWASLHSSRQCRYQRPRSGSWTPLQLLIKAKLNNKSRRGKDGKPSSRFDEPPRLPGGLSGRRAPTPRPWWRTWNRHGNSWNLETAKHSCVH